MLDRSAGPSCSLLRIYDSERSQGGLVCVFFFMRITWQTEFAATSRWVPSGFSGDVKRAGAPPVMLFGKTLSDGGI